MGGATAGVGVALAIEHRMEREGDEKAAAEAEARNAAEAVAADPGELGMDGATP